MIFEEPAPKREARRWLSGIASLAAAVLTNLFPMERCQRSVGSIDLRSSRAIVRGRLENTQAFAWIRRRGKRNTRCLRRLKGGPGDAQVADRATRARRSSVPSVGSSGSWDCGHSDAVRAGSVFTASRDVGPETQLSGLLAIKSSQGMITRNARRGDGHLQ